MNTNNPPAIESHVVNTTRPSDRDADIFGGIENALERALRRGEHFRAKIFAETLERHADRRAPR